MFGPQRHPGMEADTAVERALLGRPWRVTSHLSSGKDTGKANSGHTVGTP